MKYFAYGSNMSHKRLQARVPSAQVMGIAKLHGYSLAWHKVSKDGSGKCDIVKEYSPDNYVWGVLYEIEASDKKYLDRAEGLGNGYDEKMVMIASGSEMIAATTYFATKIDSTLRPYHWYKALVEEGARENALPDEYREKINSQECIEDPDESRAERNRFH